MNLIFEIIIDFLITIFADSTEKIIKNNKISKWVRYPVIFLCILLCVLITVVPIIIGIILLNKNIVASIIFIIIGIIFLMVIIYDVKKVLKDNKKISMEIKREK